MSVDPLRPRVARLAAQPLRDARSLGVVEVASLVLLSVAAWSAYAAPRAVAYFDEDAYTSIWNTRPLGPANVFELGFVAVAAAWLVRAFRRRGERWSALDSHVAVFPALVAVLALIALQRAGATAVYEKLDLERVDLFLAGYLLVSRLSLGARALRLFVFVLAVLLLAHFAVVTVRHGLVGSTEFATVAGRLALLITEDAVLVGLTLTVLWGLYTDRVVGHASYGAFVAALIAIVATVDFLSYRRSALLLVAGMLAVRSVRAIPRFLPVGAVAAVLAVVASEVIDGPRPRETSGPPPRTATTPTQPDTSLVADASTRQRTAELSSYARNVTGPVDIALGRGIGAAWNAAALGPVDVASYGGGETMYVRVGWHVFGLDWLYKFGVIGVLAIVALAAHAGLTAVRIIRSAADPVVRSLAWSMLAVAPFLLLMLFTNARLAVFAGVALGVASKAADVATERGREIA